MQSMRTRTQSRWAVLLATALFFGCCPPRTHASKKSIQNSQQLRSEYISRMEQQTPGAAESGTLGSLYLPSGALTDMVADYKARRIDDIVNLVVFEQTTAQSTGDANSSRTFQTSSAITNLPGRAKVGGVNPLFGANSATTLAGKGETSAGSNVTTTLSARVIGLMANGNMIVEAERKVLINSQHETMLVRGVLRPGDISPTNSAPSTALANLEIELKGKGIVTDSIRRPNPMMRGLLWLIGF
jgi:flagellar L-ring protein precursor FlgH